MDNFISIIITIYNRKEFYKEAIESTINQTLDKKYYEIIVVHYIDIDKDYDNIIYIKCDDINQGKQLSIGIENSKGNIISFLDDDDRFLPDKLQFVYDTFRNNEAIYLHNSYTSNDKSIKDKEHDFNISCISIRKNIINQDIYTVNNSIDTFMYYSALESGKKIIISDKKLTFYRIHNNNMSIRLDKDKMINYNINVIKQYLIFYQIFDNRKIKFNIRSRISGNYLYLFFNGYSFKDNNVEFDLYSYLFYSFSFYKLKTFAVYFLYKHHILKRHIT